MQLPPCTLDSFLSPVWRTSRKGEKIWKILTDPLVPAGRARGQFCTFQSMNPQVDSKLEKRTSGHSEMAFPEVWSQEKGRCSKYFYLFYFWRHWLFFAVWALSTVLSWGHSSASRRSGFSRGTQALSTRSSVGAVCGFSSCDSWALEHRFSCFIAYEIFSNPCPLHWQTEFYPLHHQGNPRCSIYR